MKFHTVILEVGKIVNEIVKRKPDRIVMNNETFKLIKANVNTSIEGNKIYFFGIKILIDNSLEIGEIQFFIEVKD